MKKRKKVFVSSTLEDRIEFLRDSITNLLKRDCIPCKCSWVLRETLKFDHLAEIGKINLKTGERK